MPILSNPRHEIFAQELAAGKSASEAYEAAGYRANRGNATSLKQQESISKRVDELLAQREKTAQKATEMAAERLSVDREWVMRRLKENAERALQAIPTRDMDGEPIGEYRYEGSVANRALELLGKELGMFIDRKETGSPGDFDRLDSGKLREEIVREANELGIDLGRLN